MFVVAEVSETSQRLSKSRVAETHCELRYGSKLAEFVATMGIPCRCIQIPNTSGITELAAMQITFFSHENQPFEKVWWNLSG